MRLALVNDQSYDQTDMYDLWKVNVVRKSLVKFLLISSLLINCSCHQGRNESNLRKDNRLVVQVVAAKKFEHYVQNEVVYGRFIPSKDTRLNFARSGVIKSLSVQVGQRVNEGDLIAELDQESVIAQRNQLQRTPGEEHQLALLETQIMQGRVVAPFNGFVAEWLVNEGANVSPSSPVCRLISDEIPVVECHLTNYQSTSLEKEGMIRFIFDKVEYEAELSWLSPVSTGLTKKATIAARNLPNDFRKFGEVVELQIPTKNSKPGYWLPISAIRQDHNGLWTVFGVYEHKTGTGRLRANFVDVDYFDADRVFLKGADLEGVPIVVSGLHRIVAGQAVDVEFIDNAAEPLGVEG